MSKMTRKKRHIAILVALMSCSILMTATGGIFWLKWYPSKVYADSVACIGLTKKETPNEKKYYPEKLEPLEVNSRVNVVQSQKNQFLRTAITYQFGEQKEYLGKETIENWLTVSDNAVDIDKEQVKAYVKGLAEKYNTVGIKRDFVTSHGKKVTVSGGPYGWKINEVKEVEDIIALIQQGATELEHQPAYSQEAKVRGVNDIGSTYVEINMTEQRMWFYKEGELQVETNVVTGNIRRGNGTPEMVAYIHNRARNINLVGDGYVAHVNYWMKISGGIGIHDASWRSRFGGRIYKTNGSHGCINTPYKSMKTLFNSIAVGTPVVVYFEKD